ncbi:Pumilio y domain member 6 [Cryptotrichosporon argae]
MSTKQRGIKRSAPDSHVGPKGKFSKTSAPRPAQGPRASADGHGNGAKSFVKRAAPVKEKEEAAPKRKRPVTQGGGEDAMSVDSEAEDGDEADDVDVGGEGEGEGEKKPRLSKAERAALHAAQPHRTTLLPSHPLLHGTLLPLWETARQTELPKDERVKAVKALWEAAKGRVAEISRGHKGGRVLQTIVKYGGKEERLGVATELQPQWRAMMESKYSKFLMAKLIRYCPSIRTPLITQLAPHMSTLLSHADAVRPLSDFYDLWASAKERRGLVRGLYPKEVRVFEGDDAKGLEEVLADMAESGRERILEGVEKTVLDVFNATQKTALAQSIFHRLVFEYLICIHRYLPADQADKKMHELLAAAQESLPEIVHTKDGSAVVRELIVRGSAKDRKSILQPLRKHVEAMCKDGDAQLVLFTAFDCVDDTKLMGKAFVGDIVAFAPSLLDDKHGRRAILYLLVPTSTKHFMPATLAVLSAAAQAARDAGTSKKDPAVRRRELLAAASEGLLKLVADDAEALVRDPSKGLVVQEIVLHAQGDKQAAIDALVAPLARPYKAPVASVAEDAEDAAEAAEPAPHVLDLAHATRTYKTLLSGGHFSTASSSIAVVDAALPPRFAAAVWAALTSPEAGGADNAVDIAAAAPFVVVELVAALEDKAAAKKVLGAQAATARIGASEAKGANVLLEKIAAL